MTKMQQTNYLQKITKLSKFRYHQAKLRIAVTNVTMVFKTEFSAEESLLAAFVLQCMFDKPVEYQFLTGIS